MGSIKYLLFLFLFFYCAVIAERLPEFSYDYKMLYQQTGLIKAPITFEEVKKEPQPRKKEHFEPKATKQEPFIKGEIQSDLGESTTIRGFHPRIIFRDDRFIKSRLLAKLHSSKNLFFYLGGFKAAGWRSDPRDMGVLAGSGVEF